MSVADDYERLTARVAELEEQEQIGYGVEPLADALRAVLAECMDQEAGGVRTLSTGRIRSAIREALG